MSEVLSREQFDKSFAVGVGRRMAQVRDAAGRSQEEVAEALGYSLSTVSAWERGRREPGLRALADLARLFDVSVGDFFPTPEGGWPEVPAEPVHQRVTRVERQLRTLREEVYAAHDHLRGDGLLPS